jgi:two-component system OmpR family response regulator
MRVLLISASRLLGKALKQGLEEEGFQVAVARDHDQGDNQARTAAPDAILLDLASPEDASLALLRRWRRDGLTAPVLLLTVPGNDDTGARDVEANQRLTKPFRLQELLDWLRTLLPRAREGPGGTVRDETDYQGPGGERVPVAIR